jgi:hypothetical protein
MPKPRPPRKGQYPRIKEVERQTTRYRNRGEALQAYRRSIDQGASHAIALTAAIFAGGGIEEEK